MSTRLAAASGAVTALVLVAVWVSDLSFERGDDRFIRPSFQGYNDAADLERLRDALAALL